MIEDWFRTVPRHAALTAVLLLSPVPLGGQVAANATLDSYRRAAEVLRQGVEAHGGMDAIRDLRAIEYRFEGMTFPRLEGYAAGAALDSAPPTQPVRVHVAADLSRGRWLSEFDISYRDGLRQRSRSVINGRELLSYQVHDLGEGFTFLRDSLAAGASAPFPFPAQLMPVLVLRQAISRAGTVRYLTLDDDADRAEHVISFAHPNGSLMTLRFDTTSKRLTGLESASNNAVFGDLAHLWRFQDFRTVDGLLIPHAFEHRINGMIQERMRLARIAVNPTLADTLFDPPAGYRPRQSTGGGPAVVRVDEGVYFVEGPGAFRAMFIDTDDGVVVLEAPLNTAAAEQTIALIEATLPGRPIRYLVLTHHHGDHIGGLPAYVARGATILIPPGTEEYFTTMLTAPRTFSTSLTPPAQSGPAPVFETVTGRRTLGGGSRAVEVIGAGPTAHVAETLVAFLPAQRLLFQADLLRIDERGLPVRGTRGPADLADIIRRHNLDVETIASARGPNGTLAALRDALGPATHHR